MRPALFADEADSLQHRLERGIVVVRRAGGDLRPEVLEAAEHFLRGFRNRRTSITYCTGLARYLRWCSETNVDPFEARPSQGRLFLASLSDLTPRTSDIYVTAVKSFYSALIGDELTAFDPLRRIKASRAGVRTPTPALTLDEFNRVLAPLADAIAGGNASYVDQRDFVLLFVGGRLGARGVSLRLATWGDWRPDGVRGSLTVALKGQATAALQVPEDVAIALEGWRAVVEEAIGRAVLAPDAVFPRCGSDSELRRTGRRSLQGMKGPSLSGLVKGRFRDAGIEGPRMATHVLRATAATIAHEAGASIEEIQHTLVHATPAMTETYIRRMRRQTSADRWSTSVGWPQRAMGAHEGTR